VHGPNGDVDEPPHKIAFGDGHTSLFDALVTSADVLPLELPVARFLEETCAGMLGAQREDDSVRSISVENRMRLKRLRLALATEAAMAVCSSLFWVALGEMFGTVAAEAHGKLREHLARSWFALSLELRGVTKPGVAKPGSTEKRSPASWVLDMLPVAFVQAIFRLLVDAFPPEHEKIVRSSDSVLNKLTQVAYKEIFGFYPTQESTKSLRAKLFCQNVLHNPAANQKESMKSELRREMQSRRNRAAQSLPLSFGEEESLPLEDMQLEHILESREREKQKACGKRTGN